jgi:biopolymer transport protein TolQ
MPPIDLSLTALYSQASGLVQAVLLTLLGCSVLCWSIILEKALLLVGLSRQTRALEWAAVNGDLRHLPEVGLGGALAVDEVRDHPPGESHVERHARLERAVTGAMAGELLKAERRLPYLATIGSSAPFIGLFGTVWGIMHSFASIAQANDTSLAVVAPGIAEALSTTAIGLAAAIPASIAYNKLASDFQGLSRRLALAAPRLVRILDAKAVP